MKDLFLCGATAATIALLNVPAPAADLGKPLYKAPATAPAAVYNWTGFYLGGNIGASWARTRTTNNAADGFGGFDNGAPETINYRSTDVTGGLQLGYNWQAAAWVFGVEADLGYLGNKKQLDYIFQNQDDFVAHKFGWYGTATARIGYAWGPSLVYAKGGAAWARITNEASDLINSAPGPFVIDNSDYSFSKKTRAGWALGGGWEYGLTPNWSTKIEYLYMDFGTYTTALNLDGETFIHRNRVQTLKFGINYRFGEYGKAPVATKY